MTKVLEAVTPQNDRNMEEPTPIPIEHKSIAAVDPPGSGRTEAKPVIENRMENQVIKRTNKPKTELEMKIMNAQDEHPSRKKDIFKAIFDSDSDNGSSDEDDVDSGEANTAPYKNPISINADMMATLTKPSTSSSAAIHSQLPDEAFRPKSAREINILRNTSPPRGIFSGLIRKQELTAKSTLNENQREISTDKTNTEIEEEDKQSLDTYGPSLPPMPPKNPHKESPASFASTSVHARNSMASVSLGKNADYRVIYEEKWIEKSDEKEKKSKKEKKHKKDKDKHKSKKQKHKKKKR